MKIKKFLSIVLVLLMVITALPLTQIQSNAYSNYETESNDTYASADTLPLNSSISGCINKSSDKDVYKITTSKNGKLTITFNHKYESKSGQANEWKIDIYQYLDGEYIYLFGRRVWRCDKEIYKMTTIGAIAGGVYYIKVTPNPYNSSGVINCEYKIENTFVSTEYYEKELNNSYDTATKMSLNRLYNGSLNSISDKDIYQIRAMKNGKISLIFKHKYSSWAIPWEINIYQYLDGEYIHIQKKYINLRDKETYNVSTIGAVRGGIYYIKVSSGATTDEASKELRDYEYGLIASEHLDQPTPKVANKNGYVSVTWSKSAGAAGYYVYRKGPNDKSWVRIANVTGTSYNDKNVKSGTNYTYTVKAYNGSTYSSYHSGVAIKYLAQPTVKTANKNGYVSVTWSKSAGAKGYYVYRKGPNDKFWVRISNVTGTSYNDKNVKSGTNYTYTVKAYNGSTYSSYHSGLTIKYLAQPTVKTANKNSYVSVTWSKSAGAKGYYVYRKGPNDKSWVRIANVTGTSYNDKNVKSGTNYTYTVKAYNGSTYSSYHSGVAIKYLSQPTFKVANKSNNVTVTWNKTAGAKGYYVYRKAANATSWTKVATVTGTSYVDKNVKKGTKYTYTVKAYNGSYNSAYHAGVTVKH